MTKSIARLQITYETANEIVTAALDYAQKNGWQIAAAVVDPDGLLVSFGRTDGVAPPIGQFAQDKAYTAGTLRKSSKAFGDRMASSPSLSLGLSTRDRLLPWGGGVAILEKDVCIGGLGVSGAQEDEDIDCANAAILSAGLKPG